MKTTLAMLLGTFVGLALFAWSLEMLFPPATRLAVAARSREARHQTTPPAGAPEVLP